ncbi:MAG: helix-turn-helix domain-containing protein [Bacteroidaceae bacterium]|nr:helix-turn-helix domain-containing protein [Bacteroidaceae bacterium]
MDKLFICLGNSYKHGNRCLAGIEVEFDYNKYVVKRDPDGKPIWFRPINRNAEAGAIPNTEALDFEVFDIVKACHIQPCPEGAQRENYYYNSLVKVSHMAKTIQNLDKLIDSTHSTLFGNRGAAVPPDKYNALDYSLILIKCSDIKFYEKDRSEWNKEPQPRGKLKYNSVKYDLPVTDPLFRQVIQNDLTKANSYDNYYLTLSLGVEHEEWHSKLIAGVIPVVGASPTMVCLPQQNIYYKRPPKEDSATVTFNLFQKGMSIDQIAAKRGFSPDTISTHLTRFIESGELDIRRLVSDEKIKRVAGYRRRHPEEDKLKPFFDAFNGEIPYTEIRWILAAIK